MALNLNILLKVLVLSSSLNLLRDGPVDNKGITRLLNLIDMVNNPELADERCASKIMVIESVIRRYNIDLTDESIDTNEYDLFKYRCLQIIIKDKMTETGNH